MKKNILPLLITIAIISVLGLGVWLLFGNGAGIVSSMARSISNTVKSSTAKAKIINLHSHPQQGENWIISFETQGISDLKIIPDDQDTIDDDDFVGLYCDDKELTPQILQGDIIYYQNWNCQGTGKVVHYTNKAGRHTFKFVFGDDELFAYNSAAWFNPAWTKRKKITIQQANIDASLSNFPLMVKVSSDSNMGAYARSDGDDVLFTKDDGITQLPHEEEWFAMDGGNASGIYWVDVPSILTVASGSATDIYMYYGNNNASDQQQATKVWKDASAKGVWHLDEGSGNAIDSTSNGNNGVVTGATQGASGKIGNAYSFDGNGDYVDVGNGQSLNFSDATFSVSVWIKQIGTSQDQVMVGHVGAGNTGWMIYQYNSGFNLAFFVYNYDNNYYWNSPLPLESWAHVVGVSNSTHTCLYRNGVLEGCQTKGGGGYVAPTNNLMIGYNPKETSGYFNGTIDNVIIYNKALSAAEIKFSYYNQDATASGGDYELTWDTEETVSNPVNMIIK